MAANVGAFEARARLSELLQRVERGERVTITKHGRPVAQLVPIEAFESRRDWPAFWERVDTRRVNLPAGNSIKSDIEAGRAQEHSS